MRLLLSENSRKNLFDFLIQKNESHSLVDLSIKMRTPLSTIQKWRYGQRYIPDKIIPTEIEDDLEVLARHSDNWGKIKGGIKSYKKLIEKYGILELNKRQVNGGKKSAKKRKEEQKKVFLDITDPMFLEFYGVLLGDGWMSRWDYNGKDVTLIGISGNAKLDRNFFMYLKNNIKTLFNRQAYLKERPKYNSIELNFSHKELLQKINKELGFPIGKKRNLKINQKIYNLGYEKMKYVIKGIFDTDGCFYFDKTPSGNPYPCISIKMKAPFLINQIRNILLNEGFKVVRSSWEGIDQIKLKGYKQLNKWMDEIGSSNPRNLNKIALVAQSG